MMRTNLFGLSWGPFLLLAFLCSDAVAQPNEELSGAPDLLESIDVSPPDPVDPSFGIETIINRFFEANQGRSQIESIQSVRISGRVDGVDFTLIKKRPKRAHLTYHFESFDVVTLYDGRTVRRVRRVGEDWELREVKPKARAHFIRDARFSSALVEYSDRFDRIRLVGETQVRGLPCYEIEIQEESGLTRVFVDQLKYRILREEHHRPDGLVTFDFDAFQILNGVWFPFEITVRGVTDSSVMNIDSIELNIGVFDSFFTDIP